MTFWAWIGAVLIGLSLGLLGSGGSILTVPVLTYLVHEPDKLAIAESLGIVAVISLVGAIPYAARRQVDWRNVVFFGVPGMAGTYLGAFLSQYLSGALQLVLFAGVMLLAAALMFRPPTAAQEARRAAGARQALWKIVLEGIVIGVLTGLVGVGGGFLIVPALVLLGGLPMHLAVGTSLLIIALKSTSGFVKYIDVLAGSGLSIHWDVVALIAVLGIAGSFAGSKIGEHISQERLKKGFAVFLVAMGVFILWQNVGRLAGTDAAPAVASTDDTSPEKREIDREINRDIPMSNAFLSFFKKSNEPGGARPVRLSPAEFVAQRSEDDVVLDVRTPAEYAGSHVEGARNIDVTAPDFRQRVEGLDRAATYYLYCRSGSRSGHAAAILREMGFENAYNVGGISELSRAGAPVE